MFGLDPGSLSSWLSAVIAALAMLIASLALRYTRRSAKASEKQRDVALNQIRHRDDKDKREQASQVAAWISASPNPVDGFPLVNLHYVNASGVPAWNLMATLTSCTTRRLKMLVVEPKDEVQVVPFSMATEWARKIIEDQLSTMRKDATDFERESTFEIASHALCHSLQETGISTIFLDSNTRTWRRDPNGVLHEIEIESDKTWMTTTLLQEQMNSLALHEEEALVHIDVVSPGAKNPDEPMRFPNPKMFPG